MKKSIFWSVLVLITALHGCKKNTEYHPVSVTPGYFILIPMVSENGLKSVKMQFAEDPGSSFDLGEIKDSREFYFILTNGGAEPIYDIRLSSSVAAFQITPEKIGYLPGKTTITGGAAGGFIPLITLGITHGTRLNGIGFAPLLPMNSNSATITISGKTLSNGDTITVSEQIDMRVNARVMDIRLFDGQAELDLTHPNASAMFIGPLGARNYRCYRMTNNSFEVQNSGNVSCTLSVYDMDMFIDSARLEPGARKTFSVTSLSSMNSLVFDGQGTITHPDRIELFDAGKGCLCISNIFK